MRWRRRAARRTRWSRRRCASGSRRWSGVFRSTRASDVFVKVIRTEWFTLGGAYALSELRKPRYPGEGLAADRGFIRHPPPAGLPLLQFPLHDVRARAAARADRHQAQRPARAVRSRQAPALG